MNAEPAFTIVIPTYQRRDVVCDAVRAIGRVNYPGKLDVVVVVDGSTDRTAEALTALNSRWPLRIVETANGGAARARNRGAVEATGDIILFLDDDMMCEPSIVREHARMYRDGADAVIGDVKLDPSSPRGFLADSTKRWLDASRTTEELSPFDVFTGQLSVRRLVFEQLGGFDEGFTSGASFSSEDSDFGVRLMERFEVRHNPAAISRQRYVVGIREFLERAPAAAAGHLHFVRKHPELRGELLQVAGRSRPLVRLVYRPLSRIPLLAPLLSRTALIIGSIGLKTPLRSSIALARVVSAARAVSYWSAVRKGGDIDGSNRLLVLGYHAMEDQSDDPVLAPYGVPRDLFARQLEALAQRGFSFVGADALAAFLTRGTPFPKRAVLVTFDDCYADLLDVAREVLKPRSIPAIAFAVTALSSNEWDAPGGAKTMRLLGAGELRELASLGVEIGSHSRTHPQLPLIDAPEREMEIAGSADDLIAAGLPRPRFFAYPYGHSDNPSAEAVQKAGYLAAFGPDQRLLGPCDDRFALPRVIVLASDRGWRFRARTGAPRAFRQAIDTRDRIRAAPGKVWRRLVGRA